MRKILAGLGLMLHVPGFMALLSVVVSIVFNESFGTEAFLLTGVASLGIGQLLYRLFSFPHRKEKIHTVYEVMVLATVGWIGAVILAAIPYFYIAHHLPDYLVQAHQIYNFREVLNALFESLSGYTSSGLTVTISESSLPYSLQWWRSFQQWIGGIGIIVFISSFFSGLPSVSSQYQRDQNELTVLPEVGISWKKIWWIYISFTLLCIFLYWVQGVPLWEAINHGMTGICTGGFSITDNSLREYSSSLKATSIFIMVLGSLNFNLYHLLLTQGRWKAFLKNQQHIFFFALLAGGFLMLLMESSWQQNLEGNSLDLLFQITSALGTCGFQSVDLEPWNSPGLMVLTLAMLIGGPTTSTTGGLKILRLLLVVQSSFLGAMKWFYQTQKAREDPLFQAVRKEEKSERVYRNTAAFIFIWIALFLIVFYILLHFVPDHFGPMEVAFECASAMATTGLSVGITGPEMHPAAKLDIMAAMLIGRLELIPIALLFTIFLRKYFALEKSKD